MGSADSARTTGPRVIVALDFPNATLALAMVSRLDPRLCRLKIGKELFVAEGPELVRSLVTRGFDVFLDLKFHDIPHTVAAAVRVAAALGVWMVNVHASGGRRMLCAAREALAGAQHCPLLIAVTVLTSMDAADLPEVGVFESPQAQVMRLSALALDCGLDGVVCSAREADSLRSRFGARPLLVTPGIRSVRDPADDQRRTLTPREAIVAGASHLVVGRPITAAADPSLALREIDSEISHVPP